MSLATDTNTIKVIREFERIQKKICRHKMSIMFNEIRLLVLDGNARSQTIVCKLLILDRNTYHITVCIKLLTAI